MKLSDIKQSVASATGTNPSDWEFMDIPETGVGVEYGLHEKNGVREAYVCVDQGEVTSLSVQ